MATDASLDVTVVGRRLRRRVLLALGLFGVLPVLVLAYAVHRYFFADVRSLSGLDLDGFKSVNDEFGHAVGDETLREIAQILMKHSRGINVVSRYGGDEFAILLVETSKAGARLYADRIRQVVATFPFSHGKSITASFGVASLPDDEAANSEDLFRAADEALYAAKRAGKNQVAAAGPAERVT